MDNYIQFPRYSIYLIPNKLFIEQVEKLLLKNNVKFDNFEISMYGLHYTVKAPFYLSHLYNEEELINSFQEYFLSNQNKSYKEVFNVLGLKKIKNVFAIEMNTNEKFSADIPFDQRGIIKGQLGFSTIFYFQEDTSKFKNYQKYIFYIFFFMD